MSELNHYTLITGQVIFTLEKEDNINAAHINGIIVTKDTKFTVKDLGKCQQILQLNFHKKLGEVAVNVVDVVIMGMTPLGHMTEEEFHALPEETKQQEMPLGPEDNNSLSLVPGMKDALDEIVSPKP